MKEIVKKIIKETCSHWIAVDDSELNSISIEIESKLGEIHECSLLEAYSKGYSVNVKQHNKVLSRLEEQKSICIKALKDIKNWNESLEEKYEDPIQIASIALERLKSSI